MSMMDTFIQSGIRNGFVVDQVTSFIHTSLYNKKNSHSINYFIFIYFLLFSLSCRYKALQYSVLNNNKRHKSCNIAINAQTERDQSLKAKQNLSFRSRAYEYCF